MTTEERTTWERIVARATAWRNGLAASIASQERKMGDPATLRSSQVRQLEEDRRQLAEYDAVIAVDAELIRFRGQEG